MLANLNQTMSSLLKNVDKKWYVGIVTPVAWDADDKPILFSLFMENGRELILRPYKEECIAKYFIGDEVKIFGNMIEDEILSYTRIQDLSKRKAQTKIKNNDYYFSDEHELHIPGSLREQYVH